MNSKLLSIDLDPGAFRHIGDMPNLTIFHLHDEVIPINHNYFGSLNCGGV
jgi:hypothetical protein